MSSRIFFYFLLTIVMIGCRKKSDPPIVDPPDETPVTITSKVVAEGLTLPWEMINGPEGNIWFTEKGGKISRLDPQTGDIEPVLTISDVVVQGEGGLLGMVMTTASSGEPFLFVAYNYTKNGNYTQKIVRYNYTNTSLTQPLIIHDDVAGAGIHNGSRLLISKDNKLFFTTGDASDKSKPQNFSSRNGKVLRINFDGSIPADNPDPSSPVWSIGHRNPQGLVFINDSLYSSEHGDDSDDEVNMIHKGGNYGWPNVRGDCEGDELTFCTANNVIEPLMKWTPTLAVCGLDYYTSDSIPQWKNSLLMCTLKASKLVQLSLSDDGQSITDTKDFFSGDYGRLRDICIAANGKVYLCTSNGSDDKIIEVQGE